MYLQHEVDKIKEQRRLKRKGIELETNLEAYDVPDTNIATDKLNEGDHDPLATNIEPFDITKELDDGIIDNDGNYVPDKKFDGVNRSDKDYDPWLNSLTDEDLYSKNKENIEYRNKPKRRSIDKLDPFKLLDNTPTIDIIKLLISKLGEDETPISALKNNKGSTRTKIPKDIFELEISDLSHVLTMIWQNVYYMTREDIIESLANYKYTNKDGSSSVPKTYEFKWVNDTSKVHGPYSQSDILRWIAYDYVTDDNSILLRELCNGEPISKEWISLKDSAIYRDMDKSREHIDKNSDVESDDVDDKKELLTDKNGKNKESDSDDSDDIEPYS